MFFVSSVNEGLVVLRWLSFNGSLLIVLGLRRFAGFEVFSGKQLG